MTAPAAAPRQRYYAWVEEQIEEFKTTLTRDELLALADEAVQTLFQSPDGQYPLTEILLCDVVDTLLFRRLGLPDYKVWARQCRLDTRKRPRESTAAVIRRVG